MDHDLLRADGEHQRQSSRLYPLLSHRVTQATDGQGLGAWLHTQRDQGVEWDAIIERLAEMTGENIAYVTLVRWHPELLSPAARGRRLTRLLTEAD